MIKMHSTEELMFFALVGIYFLIVVFGVYALYNWLCVAFICYKEHKTRNKIKRDTAKAVKQIKRMKRCYYDAELLALYEIYKGNDEVEIFDYAILEYEGESPKVIVTRKDDENG